MIWIAVLLPLAIVVGAVVGGGLLMSAMDRAAKTEERRK